ncbi:dTDP-4-amino-4,6-dideoxyglucose formyltransferase [Pedobacter sp. Leaf194]|uniref:dTDP-4-amino-4,6-dideoxyglucose formyltransferase n=1 Tax=Pedobacter sp. Leaf194 TaxID=1736297 RepID=UPI000AFD7FF2|nr:dTDP-4-amino-4,6-dideoxyglucose formyltransferase [Pedobacter sp. Leaf194]
MKKVLIISDNLQLCLRTLPIFEEYSHEFEFDYSISPFSDKKQFNEKLLGAVKVFDLRLEADVNLIIKHYSLVISIHCKQLFPESLITNIRCINIHPGYNPINRGWYPQIFSIINDSEIGATIHEIDEDIDHGNIIARSFVKKEMVDTSKSLYDKILEKEIELLRDNIEAILFNTYITIVPEDEGNLYLKRDFKELCKLNLEEKLTMLEAINRLRALSHGELNNAYFIDPDTGQKIFVTLNLKYS